MWRGNSNYNICKEGNGYCAALSGLPRGKAGTAGRAARARGISCPDPQGLFCPALQCLSPGAYSKKHPLDQGSVGSLSHRSFNTLAMVPLGVQFSHLGVVADLPSSQYVQGCFRNRETNPMCQLFQGMLFLIVQSVSRAKQEAAKQVSKETPESLSGRQKQRNPE